MEFLKAEKWTNMETHDDDGVDSGILMERRKTSRTARKWSGSLIGAGHVTQLKIDWSAPSKERRNINLQSVAI